MIFLLRQISINVLVRCIVTNFFITFSVVLEHFYSDHWFTNLEQTPLNRSQQLPAPYKRLIDEIKQNQLRENDWTTDNLTNNRRLFE